MKNAHLFLAANLLVSTALLPAAESPQRVNLALNKPYAALPAPNDRATMRMADDGAILASDQATKINVLHTHNRIVDQFSDGDGQAAQCHGVDRHVEPGQMVSVESLYD